MNDIFERTKLLLGCEAMDRLGCKRVILFGVGGVGSWCAESLVRSGIGSLTIVDPDCVCESNINRQLMATVSTIGKPKVEVLRQRLLDINPKADITAMQMAYSEHSAADFDFNNYDYIIDAIDSLKDKVLLILNACQTNAMFVSSMGAALKTDPLRIKVAEFWKVEGDPLARALRKRFKSQGQYPDKKFLCVFSDELPHAAIQSNDDGSRVNGTVMHVTASFGLALASLVIKNAC